MVWVVIFLDRVVWMDIWVEVFFVTRRVGACRGKVGKQRTDGAKSRVFSVTGPRERPPLVSGPRVARKGVEKPASMRSSDIKGMILFGFCISSPVYRGPRNIQESKNDETINCYQLWTSVSNSMCFLLGLSSKSVTAWMRLIMKFFVPCLAISICASVRTYLFYCMFH